MLPTFVNCRPQPPLRCWSWDLRSLQRRVGEMMDRHAGFPRFAMRSVPSHWKLGCSGSWDRYASVQSDTREQWFGLSFLHDHALEREFGGSGLVSECKNRLSVKSDVIFMIVSFWKGHTFCTEELPSLKASQQWLITIKKVTNSYLMIWKWQPLLDERGSLN